MDTMQLVDRYARSKTPRTATYRAMTLDEGKALGYGQHVTIRAMDGTARQVKINGKPRVWKRDPNRCEIPAKYGMYEYATFVWSPSQQAYCVPISMAVLVVAVNGDE